MDMVWRPSPALSKYVPAEDPSRESGDFHDSPLWVLMLEDFHELGELRCEEQARRALTLEQNVRVAAETVHGHLFHASARGFDEECVARIYVEFTARARQLTHPFADFRYTRFPRSIGSLPPLEGIEDAAESYIRGIRRGFSLVFPWGLLPVIPRWEHLANFGHK